MSGSEDAVDVIELALPTDLASIRGLFRAYASSLGFSLDYQGFEEEVAGLPGAYAPPSGALLVARVDGDVVGCVGMRGLEEGVCEMKRLYVRPSHRGRRESGASIGRALAEAIVHQARAAGYRVMRLDTIGEAMRSAVALYAALGFVEIPAYYASPIAGTRYLELRL